MANPFRQDRVMPARFWGRVSGLGAGLALLVFVFDQLTKFWILKVVDLDQRPPIRITPFLDLLMAWNQGVSYGLLKTNVQPLLVVMSLLISLVLWIWLARATAPIAGAALGLIIGGAMGNALDRVLHGAVADFVHLHWGNWSWYIFNVADMAIVAGVILLVYDGFWPKEPS